jgi:hypothetical protein
VGWTWNLSRLTPGVYSIRARSQGVEVIGLTLIL